MKICLRTDDDSWAGTQTGKETGVPRLHPAARCAPSRGSGPPARPCALQECPISRTGHSFRGTAGQSRFQFSHQHFSVDHGDFRAWMPVFTSKDVPSTVDAPWGVVTMKLPGFAMHVQKDAALLQDQFSVH
jgi:hypothetical protein